MIRAIFRSIFRIKIIQYIAMIMITYSMLYGDYINEEISFSTENSFGKIALGLSIVVLVLKLLSITVLSDKIIRFEFSLHVISIVFFGLGIYSGVSKDSPLGNNEFINYFVTLASYIIVLIGICVVIGVIRSMFMGSGRAEKIDEKFESNRLYYEEMLADYEWFNGCFVSAYNPEESYIVIFECEDDLVRIVDGESARMIKTCNREQFQKMVKSGITGITIKDRLFGVIRVLKAYDFEEFAEFVSQGNYM